MSVLPDVSEVLGSYSLTRRSRDQSGERTWLKLTNLKELGSFLGFARYYLRFVRDYSKIIKPLMDLTAGHPPHRKSSNKKQKDGGYFNPKEVKMSTRFQENHMASL